MADVTNESMYQLLKRVHHDVSGTLQDVSELKRGVNVIRGHPAATQADINNIYGILAPHDDRRGRIEPMLELHEFAEPQHPSDKGS